MSLQDKILDYAVILSDVSARTNYANSRSVYADHMAAALSWLADTHAGKDEILIKKNLRDYQCSFGRGYLPGSDGRLVESSFYKLLDDVGA